MAGQKRLFSLLHHGALLAYAETMNLLLEVYLTWQSSPKAPKRDGVSLPALVDVLFYLKPEERRPKHTADDLVYFLPFAILCLTSPQEQKR